MKRYNPADYSRAICAVLAGGATRQQAAAAAGVPADVFAGWLRDAEQGAKAASKLVREMAIAEGQAAAALTALIRRAAEGVARDDSPPRPEWRAAAWLLEKRFPEPRPAAAASPGTFTAAEVAELLRSVGTLLQECIADTELRTRVMHGVAKLANSLSERRSA